MDLQKIIDECTNTEFKRDLSGNPGKYLKTISAFANGNVDGYLIIGVTNNKEVFETDIDKTQLKIVDQISKKIKPTVIPETEVINYKGVDVLIVTIHPGNHTPYYCLENNKVYIRNGNQSIEAPVDVLNDLLLRGKNITWDEVVTNYAKGQLSFSVLEERMLELGMDYNGNSLKNYGLLVDDYYVRAAALLSDENPIDDSFVRCIRFKGLTRTETIDDKEFTGSVIEQIKEAINFVRKHTKLSWEIVNDTRVEKSEYKIEAVREAIVNAMVHRDYSKFGTQVDVFIYDNRIEIGSVGKPLGNKTIEEIASMKYPISSRRNRKLADILSRLKFMERSGTGFIRIRDYYKDDLENVEFIQDDDFIHVVFISRSYNEVTPQVLPKSPSSPPQDERSIKIIEFCKTAKSSKEIREMLNIKDRKYFSDSILHPLIDSGFIKMTIPDKPKSSNQKYISTDS